MIEFALRAVKFEVLSLPEPTVLLKFDSPFHIEWMIRALQWVVEKSPASASASAPTPIDWPKVGLGTKPDSQLARELGVAKQTVASARRRLGIPSYLEQLVASSSTAPQCVDWDVQPLGQVSDRELGRRLDVSSTAVRHARLKRGIEAWRS